MKQKQIQQWKTVESVAPEVLLPITVIKQQKNMQNDYEALHVSKG